MLRTRITTWMIAVVSLPVALAAVRPVWIAQDAPKPTEQHTELLKGVGEWKGTLTAFMPGAPSDPVEATETVEGIGPFWIQTRFECEWMSSPYVGTGCVGYDPAKQKYVGTWIDSTSTHIALMEGEMDPKTQTLVMRWNGPDPSGKMTPHRHETVHTPDSYTSTFYMGEGAGTKTMVIEMKRVGKKPAGTGTGK